MDHHPAFRWPFAVRMALSAALVRWSPGGGQLVRYFVLLEVVLDLLWTFIIHAMEFGLASTCCEGVMDTFDGFCKAGCGSISDWPKQNIVAVVVICYEEIIVARAGWDWESSCLVGVH